MKEIQIEVNSDGDITFVYDDDLLPLMQEGVAHIERASHVEPTADAQWLVTFESNVCDAGDEGPHGPFATRAAALAWEHQYLDARLCAIGGTR